MKHTYKRILSLFSLTTIFSVFGNSFFYSVPSNTAESPIAVGQSKNVGGGVQNLISNSLRYASADVDPFNDNHPEWFAGNNSVLSSFDNHAVKTVISSGSFDQNKNVLIPGPSAPSSASGLFDIDTNESVKISFSVPMYNEDGTNNFKSNNDGGASAGFYLNLYDADNDAIICRLRWLLWDDQYNLTNHQVYLGVEGINGSWPGNTDDYLVDSPDGSISSWVNGDARRNSSFVFVFDKTNYLQTLFGEGSGVLGRVDASDKRLKNYLDNHISSIHNIKFEITGDNGWNNEATVYLNSINDKTFKNDEPSPTPPTPTDLPPINEFTHAGSGYSINYADNGLKIDCSNKWDNSFDLGEFSVENGFDLLVNIPVKNSKGNDNCVGSFNIELVDISNPQYSIKLRYWVSDFIGSAQSPCEMFITTNGVTQDIPEIGWIDRQVGGEEGTYHISFDSTNFFMADDHNETVELDKKGWKNAEGLTLRQLVVRYLDAVGAGSRFILKLYGDRSEDFKPGDQHTFVIESLNDQSFELEDGSLRAIIKPTTSFEEVPLLFKANTNYSYDCYVKNILDFNSPVHARFLSEDKATEISDVISSNNKKVEFKTPVTPGRYYLELFTYSRRDKESGLTGKKALLVTVKDVIQDITCELVTPYRESYEKNSRLKISEPIFTGNDLVNEKITIQYKDQVNDVRASDSVRLESRHLHHQLSCRR